MALRKKLGQRIMISYKVFLLELKIATSFGLEEDYLKNKSIMFMIKFKKIIRFIEILDSKFRIIN